MYRKIEFHLKAVLVNDNDLDENFFQCVVKKDLKIQKCGLFNLKRLEILKS